MSAVELVGWTGRRNEEGLLWELEKLLCVKQREAGQENLWLGLMVSVWGWEPLVVEPPSSADVPRDVGISVLSPTLAAANGLEDSFLSLLLLSPSVFLLFFRQMIQWHEQMSYFLYFNSLCILDSFTESMFLRYWFSITFTLALVTLRIWTWTSKTKTTIES